MARAVFLDRDGVVNQVVFRGGKPASPRSLEELHLIPGIEEAAAELAAAGYRLFIVTNQPDVARAKMSAEALDAIHAVIAERVKVDEIVACTHDDHHQCRCRKPLPGMLVDLAARWDIDLRASWIVGDSKKDTEAGRAAGVRTVLLPRDYNQGTPADFEVPGPREAARLIIDHDRHTPTALNGDPT